MSVIIKLFVFVTQLTFILSELPPVQKCQLSDSSCLKTSGQAALPIFVAGMPEIGTEPLDPMKVDNIKINLAGLNLDLDDIVVKGLRKAVITQLRIDTTKKQMLLSWDTDIYLKGHYVAAGRLLILPINGDGDLTMKLKKLHVDMTIDLEVSKNPEGKDFIELKNYKYKFEVKENAHFALTNLFNGNKALSDTMLNFMNSNWRLLANEFGNAMLEKPNKKVYDTVKAYLTSQPLEEIAEN